MSGSTQENTEQNPFTRPGFIISAALILAILAAGVIIFLLPKETPQAQPAAASSAAPSPISSATASSTPSSSSEESICGLPGSDNTALGAAPKSTWTLLGTMAVPSDPATVGPGTVGANGLKSCFAHSPEGALYATANIWAASFNGYANQVYTDLAADSPSRDKALQAIKEGKELGGSNAPKVQIAGFILHSYTPEAAVVELALKSEDGGLGALATSLVWEKGDWKLDIPAAGGGTVRQISDLSSYIPWSGV
jgi:hypothetical protein